jgi:hypothetical protein
MSIAKVYFEAWRRKWQNGAILDLGCEWGLMLAGLLGKA